MPLQPEQLFPLRPPLPLPGGITEARLLEWLRQVRVEGAGEEIANYCALDFRRFVYTYGLVSELHMSSGKSGGRCLELGANPYFTTLLLQRFTGLELVLANYFNDSFGSGLHSQLVSFPDYSGRDGPVGRICSIGLDYQHFNIETSRFPFDSASFDMVLFCEIIEHLLMDPAGVLREIRRVLKPGGHLILTTPNVARLENVARLLSGSNVYDPYSGYGPYGRHNREYNMHELSLLLSATGFRVERMFTADVHENNACDFFELSRYSSLLQFRSGDLGQYVFLRARPDGQDSRRKPAWLYRSYSADELGP